MTEGGPYRTASGPRALSRVIRLCIPGATSFVAVFGLVLIVAAVYMIRTATWVDVECVRERGACTVTEHRGWTSQRREMRDVRGARLVHGEQRVDDVVLETGAGDVPLSSRPLPLATREDLDALVRVMWSHTCAVSVTPVRKTVAPSGSATVVCAIFIAALLAGGAALLRSAVRARRGVKVVIDPDRRIIRIPPFGEPGAPVEVAWHRISRVAIVEEGLRPDGVAEVGLVLVLDDGEHVPLTPRDFDYAETLEGDRRKVAAALMLP